ncbi:ATP-dependent acyl-CoA ligase [Stutzerimonas stutzeri]|uniref:ATP-dependent acyl-CoA ligase n=1 Tax=Stutzerimonas stutzeri TaxID=316 RepID=A0A2N8SX76_STUST|nr:AMP-binding protein [Stutzerimonas stutzeri]MCQ4325314.1 AMP-binding protein [Stutzerimonas stutzeri]PNG07092.1 ATP-dependent acyl-CoA ligase [Stutzerimonas stutzeri]
MQHDASLILANVIRRKVEETPDLDVLTFVHVGADQQLHECSRSYRQLWENGQRIASGLDDEWMRQGDAFALIMFNHPEFVEAMVGSSIANTVFVPIDARACGDKLHYLLSFSACRGAIVADHALTAVLELAERLPNLDWLWVLDTGAGLDELPSHPRVRVRSLSDVLDDRVPDIAVRASDLQQPMQLLFTSGTTGNPKAIVAPYARFAAIASLGAEVGLQPGDRPYTGLSLTHANAQCITLGNALFMGLRAVISRQFTKSRLWEILRRYQCTVFNLLGGMTTAVYSEPPRADDGDNPVRYVFSAGMPASIWQDFARRFNVEIFEFYGTAEGGLTLNPPGVGPIGSIGKPPSHLSCAILDENGNQVPPGQRGEICFRAASGAEHPPVAYLNNPQASADKTRGGWFHSGDIGHKDAQGWVYFDYRDGSGIRRNGEFIDPAQIEKVIAEMDSVADVFVYGLPWPTCAPGEKEIVAAVVALPGHVLEHSQLLAHCSRYLPRNLLPSHVQVLDEIPKTASEKPLERILRESLEGELSTASTQQQTA